MGNIFFKGVDPRRFIATENLKNKNTDLACCWMRLSEFLSNWYNERHYKPLQFDTSLNDNDLHSQSQSNEKARATGLIFNPNE